MAAGRALDLNSATFDELCSITGVGPALARRIIEFRQRQGPITSPDQLLRIEGLTPGLVARLRPYVRAAPTPAPVPLAEAEPRSDGSAIAGAPAGPDQASPLPEKEIQTVGAHEPTTESEVSPLANEPPASAGDGARPEEGAPTSEPATGPLAAPTLGSLFDDEDEWPRSYGGVSSSILFGEADSVPETSTPAYRSRSAGSSLSPGRLVLLVIVSGALGAALSLAGLMALNGSLYYVPQDQMEPGLILRLDALEDETQALSTRLEATSNRIGDVESQIDSVNTTLQDLDGNLTALEVRVAEVERLRDELEGIILQVDMLADDVGALETGLANLSASAERFSDFLEAVRGALPEAAE